MTPVELFDGLNFMQQGIMQTTALGGMLGALTSLFLTRKSLLLLAGHATRHVAWNATRATTKGLFIGSAIGLVFELMRQADWVLPSKDDSQSLGKKSVASAFSEANTIHRLTQILQQYGYEHQSFLSLYGGMEAWWSEEPEAAIVFRRIGQVLVVVAAPLATKESWSTVTLNFLEHCRRENLTCLMLPVGEEFAAIARKCGMAVLCIGQSGYFKLPEWKPAGDKAKKVRAGVNQARNAGITVECFDPDSDNSTNTCTEVETLCRHWVGTREIDALGWLLELNPFKLSQHKRYFLARDANGNLCGFLACSPIYARRGWYLEDLIRHAQSDRGVSELLVTEALKYLSAEGAQLATLATSPLAGVEPEDDFKLVARVLKLIYRHAETFYHFRQLHRFKAKFAPSFTEKEFVAVYPPKFKLKPVIALVRAFEPRGLTGLVVSKLRKTGSCSFSND